MSNWLQEAITRQEKYDAGYEDGYKMGKQVAAALIFADLEKVGGFDSGQLILFANEYKEIKNKYGVHE
jgi:hypothetical protein